MVLCKFNKIARNDRIYLSKLKFDDLINLIEYDGAITIGIDNALNFNNYLFFHKRSEFLDDNPIIFKLQEAEYNNAMSLEEYDSLSYFNKEVDDMVNFANKFPILKPIIHVVYKEL